MQHYIVLKMAILDENVGVGGFFGKNREMEEII